jgi:hypothetical protein
MLSDELKAYRDQKFRAIMEAATGASDNDDLVPMELEELNAAIDALVWTAASLICAMHLIQPSHEKLASIVDQAHRSIIDQMKVILDSN